MSAKENGERDARYLSKRETIAMHIMAAIVNKTPFQTAGINGWSHAQADERREIIARGAVENADALLAELAKEKP